jgi:hypothetical protein
MTLFYEASPKFKLDKAKIFVILILHQKKQKILKFHAFQVMKEISNLVVSYVLGFSNEKIAESKIKKFHGVMLEND